MTSCEGHKMIGLRLYPFRYTLCLRTRQAANPLLKTYPLSKRVV